jgi:hypothetical protein
MSPYRVLVKDYKRVNSLLAAMLSKSSTNELRIFIIDKTIPLGYGPKEIKKLAHKMSTINNSSILAKYVIIYDDITHHYKVERHQKNSTYTLYNEQFTQGDCLRVALEDFCAKEGFSIIENL